MALRSRVSSVVACAILAPVAWAFGVEEAAADHGTCLSSTHTVEHHFDGTVRNGVPKNYFRASLVQSQVLLDVNPPDDADLYVWRVGSTGNDCLVLHCVSGEIGDDACFALAGFIVEVRFFAGHDCGPLGMCVPYILHEHDMAGPP